jgi:hypothetical protein
VSTIGCAFSLEPGREPAAGLVMAARRVILPAPARGGTEEGLGFWGKEEERNGVGTWG